VFRGLGSVVAVETMTSWCGSRGSCWRGRCGDAEVAVFAGHGLYPLILVNMQFVMVATRRMY